MEIRGGTEISSSTFRSSTMSHLSETKTISDVASSKPTDNSPNTNGSSNRRSGHKGRHGRAKKKGDIAELGDNVFFNAEANRGRSYEVRSGLNGKGFSTVWFTQGSHSEFKYSFETPNNDNMLSQNQDKRIAISITVPFVSLLLLEP